MSGDPDKGTFDTPAPGQDNEASHIVGAFDDLERDFAGVTAIDPDHRWMIISRSPGTAAAVLAYV